MSRRSKVEYIQQGAPKFIQQMKERSGIVDNSLEEKCRSVVPDDNDDLEDRLDERPQIVLELSNVGEEEAKKFIEEQNACDFNTQLANDDIVDLEVPSRIIFRTAEQRKQIQNKSEMGKTNPKPKTNSRDRSPLNSNKPSKSLLSFSMDDENDE